MCAAGTHRLAPANGPSPTRACTYPNALAPSRSLSCVYARMRLRARRGGAAQDVLDCFHSFIVKVRVRALALVAEMDGKTASFKAMTLVIGQPPVYRRSSSFRSLCLPRRAAQHR